MMLFLESETVKLSVPKNIYSEDTVISTDVVMSVTSKSSIKHRGLCNASDDKETEMIVARWKSFKF